MTPSGGKLYIELIHTDIDRGHLNLNPGPHMRLRAKDTGHGISPQIIDRIFDPYFTTKEIGQGTGLGLAMVHSIVQSYGGVMHVDSVLGEGATFELLLPEIKDVEHHGQTFENSELPAGTEHILLVDDEKHLVGIGQRILGRLGYQVVGKTGSIGAMETFKADPVAFDLVITDMTMPRMTGIELAQNIRAIKPDFPILLCTGFNNNMKPEFLASSGIQGIIKKPFSPADLAVAVRKLLDQDDFSEDQDRPSSA